MLCPRCARETDERAAFCGACAAPLTLRDEPALRTLDVTLDLDRRRSRTPPSLSSASPRPPAAPARGAQPPEPAFVAPPAPAPASRSHWDLGRMVEEALRDAGVAAGASAPAGAPVAAPHLAAPAAESASFAWSDAAPQRWPDAAPEVIDADEAEVADVAEVAAVAVRPAEVHLRRPATWRRAGAWAIDAGPLVAGVVYLGVSLLAPTGSGVAAGLDGLLDLLAREKDVVLSLVALLALALAVYATLAHALAGATLGKWILGLRVVGPGGRRPSLARSAVRSGLAAASFALLGLGFLLALFTRSGRALHDLLARTWVVEAP